MTQEQKIEKIMDEWKGFTDGVRVLFLIWRNKEGAKEVRNLKIRKLISSNEEELYYMETYELQLFQKLVENELLRRKIYKYDRGTNYETDLA